MTNKAGPLPLITDVLKTRDEKIWGPGIAGPDPTGPTQAVFTVSLTFSSCCSTLRTPTMLSILGLPPGPNMR